MKTHNKLIKLPFGLFLGKETKVVGVDSAEAYVSTDPARY